MTQRLPHQCLRISLTSPFSALPSRRLGNHVCLRKYNAAIPFPDEEDAVETPPQPPRKISRKVLPEDLLPFNPPPSKKQHAAEAINPVDLPPELTDVVPPAPGGRPGPIPLRIRKTFPVNQSWTSLDKFYVNLFGFEDYLERGFLKSKELAWQCVTHKSYNHGVDAYNEKLAHFGLRVIQMVTAQHVLTFPAEEGGPTLNNLNVNALSKSLMANVMDHQLIGDMGLRYGVGEVMRWKPAFNVNLGRSGIRSVAGECMLSIAGAVTMSKGTVDGRAFIVNRYLQLLLQNPGNRTLV